VISVKTKITKIVATVAFLAQNALKHVCSHGSTSDLAGKAYNFCIFKEGREAGEREMKMYTEMRE